MLIQWVTVLLVAGVAFASENTCNVTQVSECYADLVHYESLAFPLYGQDEAELDNTCSHITESFDCVQAYTEDCYNNPDCDVECEEMIPDFIGFLRNTGLKNFAEMLCDKKNLLRQTYLEIYDCLAGNADTYASCHNESQKSLQYLNTLTGPESIPSRCCYFTWYHDCFKNVTEDHCGVNATFFVSYAMHHLVGHIVSELCKYTNATCEKPPLPSEGDYIDNTIDDADDSENEIPDNSSVRLQFYIVDIAFLFYCFTVLSKYFL